MLMTTEVSCSFKIKPEHLARKAIVYLRQSSEKQVRQNKESQNLQYAVAERMRVLGWKQVEIIDSDLGFSAGMASAAERVSSVFSARWLWERSESLAAGMYHGSPARTKIGADCSRCVRFSGP